MPIREGEECNARARRGIQSSKHAGSSAAVDACKIGRLLFHSSAGTRLSVLNRCSVPLSQVKHSVLAVGVVFILLRRIYETNEQHSVVSAVKLIEVQIGEHAEYSRTWAEVGVFQHERPLASTGVK